MPDTVLGSKDIAMNERDKNPCPHRAYILLGETNKEIKGQ